MSKIYYDQADVATPLVIDFIDQVHPSVDVGISFYSDAALTTLVDSGMTGSYTISVIPTVNEYEQDVAGAVDVDISVAANVVAPTNVASSIKKITITPTAITGASYWALRMRGA